MNKVNNTQKKKTFLPIYISHCLRTIQANYMNFYNVFYSKRTTFNNTKENEFLDYLHITYV